MEKFANHISVVLTISTAEERAEYLRHACAAGRGAWCGCAGCASLEDRSSRAAGELVSRAELVDIARGRY